MPTAKPSPPPKTSVGWPAPPSTAREREPAERVADPLLGLAVVLWTPGAHWPMSSIAALPLPKVPSWRGYWRPGTLLERLQVDQLLELVPAVTKHGPVQSPVLMA